MHTYTCSDGYCQGVKKRHRDNPPYHPPYHPPYLRACQRNTRTASGKCIFGNGDVHHDTWHATYTRSSCPLGARSTWKIIFGKSLPTVWLKSAAFSHSAPGVVGSAQKPCRHWRMASAGYWSCAERAACVRECARAWACAFVRVDRRVCLRSAARRWGC